MDQTCVKELKLVYSIQQETQGGEIVDKIIWNENMTDMILELVQNEKEAQVLGLYGTIETIKEYLEQKECCTLMIEQQIIDHSERGQLCLLIQDQIYYLAFIASNKYFTKDLFIKSEEISVYRFLRDIAQNIILLPSKEILTGWKTQNLQCNQNQSNKICKYKLKELVDTELEVKQINLQINEKYRKEFQNTLQAQKNIRCQQLINYNATIDYYDDIFDLIVCDSKEIKDISFPQLVKEDQQILKTIIKDTHDKLNEWFKNQFNEQKKKIKEQKYYLVIPKKLFIGDLLEQLHDCIVGPIRALINSKQNDLVASVKQKFSGHKHLDSLLQVVQTYEEEFHHLLHKQNKLQPIKQYFQQQIAQNIHTNLYINIKHFEFQYITSKDLSQHSTCIIQEQMVEQINIKEVVDKQQQNLKHFVQYHFRTSKKVNMFIVKNFEHKVNYWINYQQSHTQLIARINQSDFRQLLYHYEDSNTTLYIFNTKIGISSIFYDEPRNQKGQETNISNNSIFYSICFLKCYSCFILMDNRCQLWKWKLQSSKVEAVNLDKNSFKPTQNQNTTYNQVMSTGQGSYFCLSNQEKLDIFNFNNQIVIQIIFQTYGITCQNAQQIKLFSNQRDWFIILFDAAKPQQVALQISNINNQSLLIDENVQIDKKECYSNPYIDLIQASIDKYGPNLNLSNSTKITSKLYASLDVYKKIESYFNMFELNQSDQLIETQNLYQIQGQQTFNKIFSFVLITRIPIQLCSMDSSYLVPLSNGLKIQRNNQAEETSIYQYVEQIKFGILEKLLIQLGQKVFILSIIGKQSSGKSYLLNRIFGTRFSVSSARCTDGIWMSIGQLENQLFIIFDCEGLFSTQRTSDEEIKLLSFLVSLSDLTILNQDLTFNRNFNDLFKNLQETVKYIKGEQLFKGVLMIIVRDVNRSEQDEADKELKKSLDLITVGTQNSFIKQLFNGTIQTKLLCNFEVTSPFENGIKDLRQDFLNNSKQNDRWNVNQNIIGIMKILLVQLNVTDNCSLEEHEYQIRFKQLNKKLIGLWRTYQQNSVQNLQFEDDVNTYDNLMQITQFGNPYSSNTINHNKILEKKQLIFKSILDQRIQLILESVDEEFEQIFKKNNINFQDENKKVKEKQKLYQELLQLSQFYEICQEKCSVCYLNCTQNKNHIKNDMFTQKNKLIDQLQVITEQLEQLKGQINQPQNCSDQLQSIQGELTNNLTQLNEASKLVDYLELDLNIRQKEEQLNNLLRNNCYNYDQYIQMINDELVKLIPNYGVAKQNILKDLELIHQEKDSELNAFIQEQLQFQEEKTKLQFRLDDLNKEKIDFQLNCIEKDIKQMNDNMEINKIQRIELEETFQKINQKLMDQNIQQYILPLEDYQNIYSKYEKKFEKQMQFQSKSYTELNEEISDFATLEEYLVEKEQSFVDIIQENTDTLGKIVKSIESKMKVGQSKLKQKSQVKDNTTLEDLQLQQKEIEQIIEINQSMLDFVQHCKKDIQEKQKLNSELEQKELDDCLVFQEKRNHQQITPLQTKEDVISGLFNIENPNFKVELDCIKQSMSDADVAIQYCQNQLKLTEINQKFQESLQLDQNLQSNIIRLEQEKIYKSSQLKLQVGEKQIILNKMQDLQESLEKIKSSILIKKEVNFRINQIYDQYREITDIYCQIENLKQQIKSYNLDKSNLQPLELLKDKQKNIKLNIQNLDEQREILQKFVQYQQEQQSKQKELDELEQSISSKHNCGRQSHQCDQICQSCSQETKECKDLAGHLSTVHLCSNNEHFCKQQCSVENCENTCQQQFLHNDKVKHLCNNNHPCKHKCQYNQCQNDCSISASELHIDHKCLIKKCTRLCYFGENYFSENLKCNGKCSHDHTESHDIHICDHERHQCNQSCQLEGVCRIETYTEITKTKQSGLTTLTYKFIKQNQKKIQCQLFIEKGKIHHHQKHSCGILQHLCEERCPECDGFCTENYKHEGQHKTIHRNQDSQQITYIDGEQQMIQQDDESTLQFKVGEINEAETCTTSCKRKSRAHYHLIECKKENGCLADLLNRQENKTVANHQTKTYLGSNKQYDEVLCQYFWSYFKWETPYHDQQNQNYINQCNYYCNICENKDKLFCQLEAWHTISSNYKDHDFLCKDFHKDLDGVDVQFVIDTTGSMEKHIDLVKKTIKKTIDDAHQYLYKDQSCVKFSIVSYKDHLDVVDIDKLQIQDVCQAIDFTDHNKSIEFLTSLKAEGGGDFPEAMLDGLDKASQMGWRDKTKKILILIAESPPHGSPKFHNQDDDFPHGCPCGRNETEVLTKLKEKNIKIFFYKINDSLNQTIEIFKQLVPNIEEMKSMNPEQFVSKIQFMVCQELKVRDVTIKKE